MPSPRLISVFKSLRRAEMYLHVDKKQGLKAVPEVLIKQFGKTGHVFDLLLDENRQLARAKATDVLLSIEDKGFYLQMPPGEESSSLPAGRASQS